MPDRLYLSLWFPSFQEREMMPRLLGVLRQFPFSASHPGIGQVTVHPMSWNEPVIFQQTLDYRAEPERVLSLAGEFLHSDCAYELEALWNLWAPSAPELWPIVDGVEGAPSAGAPPGDVSDEAVAGESGSWLLQPRAARFVAYGTEFAEGVSREMGHIQVDFGLDTPFLYEDLELTPAIEQRVKANVQKLVSFTMAVEKNCAISGRVLWSESEENLAQKLLARLQRAQ